MATQHAETPVTPKKQWDKYFASSFILVSILATSMGYSFIDPIYPQEAAIKGIPASQFGFVFGVFQLAYLFTSPVFGAYANSLGPTSMFTAGMLILSFSTITFGFLTWVPAGAPFLAVSIVIRIVIGMAEAAICISGYILAIACHPTNISLAMSIVHSTYIVGTTIGPTIGSSLYGIGHFYLPFLVIGGTQLFLCLMSICVLKSISCEEDSSSREGPKVSKVIRNPRVFIACFVVFVIATTITSNVALLEVHIRPFNLSESSIGLVFMAIAGPYTISAVFWGRFTKKIGHFDIMIIAGLMTSAVGLLLIGPAPFIPIPLTIGLVVTSLVFMGFGCGCAVANIFMELTVIVAGDGPQDLTTKGFVSGLFSSTTSLGCFVGPTVGGPLYDLIGFSLTSMVVLGLDLLTVIVVGIVVLSNCIQNKHLKQSSELANHPK